MRIHGPADGRVEARRGDDQADSQRTGDTPAHGSSAVAVIASSVTALNARAQAEAVARADRLQSLCDQIAHGDYRIDFERLSERILSDELSRIPGRQAVRKGVP